MTVTEAVFETDSGVEILILASTVSVKKTHTVICKYGDGSRLRYSNSYSSCLWCSNRRIHYKYSSGGQNTRALRSRPWNVPRASSHRRMANSDTTLQTGGESINGVGGWE